jgi:hypothetical protein
MLRHRRRLISGLEKLGLRGPIHWALNTADRLIQGRSRAPLPGHTMSNAGLGLAWPVTPDTPPIEPIEGHRATK